MQSTQARDTDELLDGQATQPTEPTAGSSRPTAGEAVRMRWWLILLLALLLAGAGIALGLDRSPTYGAESRLSVGSFDAATQSVPGYVEASEDLASAYSRIAESDVVLGRVARESGMSLVEIRDRVTAAPIPESPVLRIDATGPSAESATGLATAATGTLRSYINESQDPDARSDELLGEFRKWSRVAVTLEARLERRRQARERDRGAVSADLIQQTEAAAEVARLRADGTATAYQSARERDRAEGADLTVIESPQAADSDRLAVVQQLGFVGLVGGGIVGAALAVLLPFRRSRAR